MPHSSRAIANEFLKRAQADGRALTNMQLQKLPYIAHGWSLALYNAPLISERPETWPYGPVYRDLYNSLKRFGAGSVEGFVHVNDGNIFADSRGARVEEPLTPDETKLLKAVWENYKEFNAYQLSDMTHREGTPWTEIYQGDGVYKPIPDEVIKRHYLELVQNRKSE